MASTKYNFQPHVSPNNLLSYLQFINTYGTKTQFDNYVNKFLDLYCNDTKIMHITINESDLINLITYSSEHISNPEILLKKIYLLLINN